MERFKYHFEPKKGWMNDPNGLCEFKGEYHMFFQHYPHDAKWGQMHWGHVTTRDFINYEELEIALYPDMPYENDGGCFSGSAIENDGKLYLFYTSVSHELGQTQSVAISEDGRHFAKYEGNPVIDRFPQGEGSHDFRDPKVLKYKDEYRMVVGSRGDGKLKIYPVSEVESLLSDKLKGVVPGISVEVEGGSVTVKSSISGQVKRIEIPIESVDILEDSKAVEVFINKGEKSISMWR